MLSFSFYAVPLVFLNRVILVLENAKARLLKKDASLKEASSIGVAPVEMKEIKDDIKEARIELKEKTWVSSP
jgi:hypothetical protein